MSIKVRYFASLKEQLGRSHDSLDYTNALSVREIWLACTEQKPLPDNTIAAINMEYAELDSLVEDGDEVAFFPPVTGGQRDD
jgi:sulfur-carrier protein